MGQDQAKPRPRPMVPPTTLAKFADRQFPFENLVLEGGGAKGIGYVGALKALEDAGILSQIKRLAGTSAGAITASFLAIGMTPEEILDELSGVDLQNMTLDSRWPTLSSIPGMKQVTYFWDVLTERGACPGQKFLEWFGDVLDRNLRKRGVPLDKDITFDQVYHVLGKELCLVAFNMNYNRESYFHVKTTPILRVREAVRMSMTIPLVFQPFQDVDSSYIDGSTNANYPIYAYDGWYLSMDAADTFYQRLRMMDERRPKEVDRIFYPEYSMDRFQSSGKEEWEKTLGILVFSKTDREPYQDEFDDRLLKLMESDPSYKKKRPDTEKARAFAKATEKQERQKEHSLKGFAHLVDSKIKGLIEAINGEDIDGVAVNFHCGHHQGQAKDSDSHGKKISVEEARKHFDKIFTDEDIEVLRVNSKDEAFKMLLLDHSGQVTDDRIKNIYWNYAPLELARQDILGKRHVESSASVFGALHALLGSVNKLTREDIKRTIAVDTDYVDSLDFDMLPADMEFLMQQGVTATTAYIMEYVETMSPPAKVTEKR
ncbi:uncharacterized protein LOC144878118 [Branchiostoma floridae x Branchiostoma japonicum]